MNLATQRIEQQYDVRIHKARRGWYYSKERPGLFVLSRDYLTLEEIADRLQEEER